MSRGRLNPLGVGMAVGAAGAATAAGAAGLVADRLRRRQDAALPEYASLIEAPTLTRTVVASDGVRLYAAVDEPGSGVPADSAASRPTIVFTHGYCLTSECWVLQRRALVRAGYRVVTWDQRGHGRSEKGPKSHYWIDQLGEDLYAVVQACAPEGPLAFAGHSMGGMTTMAFAEAHPDVIVDRTLAFACISTSPGGLKLANTFTGTIGMQLLERLGPGAFHQLQRRPALLAALLTANKDLADFLVERYSFASPVPRSVVRLTAKMLLGNDLTVVSDFVPTFNAYDKTAALRHFAGVETLVFNGVQDILTPPDHSELIVRGIPGAEHVVIRDAGHVIMLEHPELLNEQILAMLERADLAAARHIHVDDKPRVTRMVTPLAKKRAVREGLRQMRQQRRHHVGP